MLLHDTGTSKKPSDNPELSKLVNEINPDTDSTVLKTKTALRIERAAWDSDKSTKPSNNPDLLGNEQAAWYLGVTPKTLEVWRSTKRYSIPFIKVGRLVKYRKSALDAFLESRTVGTEA